MPSIIMLCIRQMLFIDLLINSVFCVLYDILFNLSKHRHTADRFSCLSPLTISQLLQHWIWTAVKQHKGRGPVPSWPLFLADLIFNWATCHVFQPFLRHRSSSPVISLSNWHCSFHRVFCCWWSTFDFHSNCVCAWWYDGLNSCMSDVTTSIHSWW